MILLHLSAFVAPFSVAANAAFYYVNAAFAFVRNASLLVSVCQVIKAVRHFIGFFLGDGLCVSVGCVIPSYSGVQRCVGAIGECRDA